MLHDSVLLQCPGHLVGQRRALGGKLPLAVHRRQDFGSLAQRRDGHEVRRHEESEGRGVVRRAERRDDQPHGFHGVAAPHMAAGVQLTVRRAQEGVIARTLLHLLFAKRLHDVAHRRGPLPVEDRRVARGLPVVVRKAQRIAVRVDLPFALENPGTLIVARIADILADARRPDVEGISVRVDIDEFELPPDNPRDHLLQRRVLLAQLHIGPYLRPGVAEPHGRNIARVDVGIGIARFVLAVVHRGVERVGEAVGEHPPQAFVGQKTAHAGDLPLYRFRLKKPLLLRGPLVGVRLRFVRTVPHLLFGPHLEAQLPALHQVGMTDPRLRVGLTIEPNTLDIFVRSGVVFGRDREHAARDLHFGPVEER